MSTSRPGPGTVTTIGVISLVLGLLTVLACLISFFPMAELYGPAMRQGSFVPAPSPQPPPPIPPPPPRVPLPAPSIATYDGDFKGPAGLGRVDAYVVATAWEAALDLPPDRRTMLRRFLRDFGARVFPPAAGPVTDASARAALVEGGQLPAGPNGLGTRGTH